MRKIHPRQDLALPGIEELGVDLLVTTCNQRRLALARPYLGLACYILAVYFKLWWLTPIIVFVTFVAVVTVTHDVVHRSLGLSRRQTEWALFLLGVVLLESGHAYRATHVQHHTYFPAEEVQDPEGYPAHLRLVGPSVMVPFFSIASGGGPFDTTRNDQDSVPG